LFSIFIADMESSVLRPFDSAKNFLLQDFKVSGIPISGLLYADDLVIFGRSQRGLRERLKRLGEYVKTNKLTVNVSKSEVVIFGAFSGKCSFKFLGVALPMRQSCKYLGINFSVRDGVGEHFLSLPSRFSSAVVTFFQLLRRLKASHLQLVGRLQTALLLSALYGIEFASDPLIAASLSLAYRKGLRSFLGVPTRVSNDFLLMLFPRLNFELFIAGRKLGFLRRSLSPSDTLASIFFLADRAEDFPNHVGFSADLLVYLRRLGLPELINCDDKCVVSRALAEAQDQELILAWERMRSAKSTAFLCSIFSGPAELHRALVSASAVNHSMLRIFVLMWTGSLAIQVFGAHERFCRFCSQALDSRHFFGCHFDTCDQLRLIVAVRNGHFSFVNWFTCQAFFRFLFRSKPFILHEEEALLADVMEDEIRFNALCYASGGDSAE
jgi:hypothetical protein